MRTPHLHFELILPKYLSLPLSPTFHFPSRSFSQTNLHLLRYFFGVLPVDQGNHRPRLFERRANVGAAFFRKGMAELELQSILLGRTIIPLHIFPFTWTFSPLFSSHSIQSQNSTRRGCPKTVRWAFLIQFLVVFLLLFTSFISSVVAAFSSLTLHALLKFTVTFSANRFSYSTKIKLQKFSRAVRFSF